MSLFANYIEGGDEVFTREARMNLLATTQLDVVSATVNVESSTTLDLGANADAQSINLGTGAVANTITIGNTTGATSVAISSGTGDILLTSTDRITLDATGRIILDSDLFININAVDTSSGITIGGDTNEAPINIGTVATRTIMIGDPTASGRIHIRTGTGGLIKNYNVVTIADSANAPSAANYVSGLIHTTGGGADTWTLPTGAALADAMPSAAVNIGDSFECVLVNDAGGALTLAAGASGSTITNNSADLTVEDNQLARLLFVFNVATPGSEEYFVLLNKSA